MRAETAQKLAQLNTAFYARVSGSFSSTRESPWAGWQRILECTSLSTRLRQAQGVLTVLDLACGNLRFERFLDAGLQQAPTPAGLVAYAYDNCDDLVTRLPAEHVEVRYTHLDVLSVLFAEEALEHHLGVTDCDLAVCFGFMHHLALPEHRQRVLQALVSCVAPRCEVAVSFWQLSNSKRLLAKAQQTTLTQAPMLGLDDLGAGDYLLDWQGHSDVLRFCHDLTEEEIDELSSAISPYAREIKRFSADGAEGNLNRYLVFRREPL